MPPETKPKEFNFSNDELNFLAPRQMMLDQYRLVSGDIDFSMQQYVIRVVLPRLGITKPDEYKIIYDIHEKKIILETLPPKIITPGDKIITPNK